MLTPTAARVTPLRDTEPDDIRTPPYNSEAEQALLGALLIKNAAYSRVSSFLQPEHFGNAVHARIYVAIGKMVERGQIANPVTLKNLFDQDSALGKIGGWRYPVQLVDNAVTILNAEDYGRVICDLYLRRQLIVLGEDIVSDAFRQDLDRPAMALIASAKGDLADRSSRAPDLMSINVDLLSGTHWLTRDIPEPDFLLGELLSTTTRAELIGPTGLGKTNFLTALGIAAADGRDFLHWRGHGRPRCVLYVDGEMSRRLVKKRIADATRRVGGQLPPTFFFLNREDFPDEFQPLNTEAGQKFIDVVIGRLGGVDLAIFDNVRALLGGSMIDEEPWQQTLPWIRDLTRRNIGQIWAHHTGHDESHGYGSKTREWHLDTIALMERIKRPEADIAFRLKFNKARERSPDNRADFEPAAITLCNDEWASERGDIPRGRPQAKDRALVLLIDAINRHGEEPPANRYIPAGIRCVTEDPWRQSCKAGCISEGSPATADKAFLRASKKLLQAGRIGVWQPWVWVIPT